MNPNCGFVCDISLFELDYRVFSQNCDFELWTYEYVVFGFCIVEVVLVCL